MIIVKLEGTDFQGVQEKFRKPENGLVISFRRSHNLSLTHMLGFTEQEQMRVKPDRGDTHPTAIGYRRKLLKSAISGCLKEEAILQKDTVTARV